METLPSTCTGFNTLTIPNDTVYSLKVLDGSNSNGDVTLTTEGTSDQIVNSFWMAIGSYKFFLTMNRSSDPNNKMIVLFDATSELTAFMVLVVSLTYLAFFVIAVQAVISQDYYWIKHMIYSAQFIHLISLVAVNLPPPMVYFVQVCIHLILIFIENEHLWIYRRNIFKIILLEQLQSYEDR